jgi:DinB superfamily
MTSLPRLVPRWLALALVAAVIVPLRAAELTPLERSRLTAHVMMTESWLIDEVANLSSDQLSFRPSPRSWTIMEVVEHLVVVGPIYWSDLQTAVRGPRLNRDLSNGDANILWYGIDRTSRETAIPSERPPGRLRDLKAGLDALRRDHERLLEYVKTTKDDLRRHLVERQACDAYQWALLISTHEQRHILQIREIKADPKFPRK